MSKHTSYRGVTIDMDSMRRENEKVPAIGNLNVNAKGDSIGRSGTVTKTADQIARENHRVKTMVTATGLKGPLPQSAEIVPPNTKVTPKKTKETELPSGDIIVEDDTNAS
jgi:predicted small lipoprotein YifL